MIFFFFFFYLAIAYSGSNGRSL